MSDSRHDGVIESVGTGFRVTNRHLRLLLIPIALDLFIWLGPRVSVEPLIVRLAGGSAIDASVTTLDGVMAGVTGLNLVGLLAMAMPSAVDIFAFSGTRESAALVSSWPMAIALASVFLAAGFLIGALYRSAAVQGLVRDNDEGWTGDVIRSTFLEAAPRYVRLLAVIALVGAIGFLALAVFYAGGEAITPGLGRFLLILSSGFILWLVFLFFLSEVAVFVSGTGALASLRASAEVVRAFFLPSLGLFAMLRTIDLGLGLLWGRMGESPLALLTAIAANAYVATGLLLGAMVYYRNRIHMIRGRA
ncbi:MAG: hypothetical protein O3B84_08685 [Chloroflexi bacterium]|nr:hypothetical protein [Chloroflexota bacterium]